MSLLGFLSSAVGGALLGEVGKWATGFLEMKKADAESKRKLAELKAMSEIKVTEEQWKTFRETLSQGNSEYSIPENLGPKSLTIISFVLLGVHTATKMVRVVMVGWAAVFMYFLWNSTPEGPDKTYLLYELTAISFAVIYWWIGERYQKRTLK